MELSKLEIDLIYPTFWGSIKENGIIQSGNGFISSTSQPQIKKLCLQKVS